LESFRSLLRMGETVLSSPHETERFVPFILNFGGDTDDESLCTEEPLVCRCRRFPSFAFFKIAENCVLVEDLSRWTFSIIS
jgi:hypothetical protein